MTSVNFNRDFFDNILKSAGVEKLVKEKAEQAARIARTTAPVDTGEYRDSIHTEKAAFKYRTGYHVVADDRKALLIEAKTGNLARALKATK